MLAVSKMFGKAAMDVKEDEDKVRRRRRRDEKKVG
jgi:hypothetical protein